MVRKLFVALLITLVACTVSACSVRVIDVDTSAPAQQEAYNESNNSYYDVGFAGFTMYAGYNYYQPVLVSGSYGYVYYFPTGCGNFYWNCWNERQQIPITNTTTVYETQVVVYDRHRKQTHKDWRNWNDHRLQSGNPGHGPHWKGGNPPQANQPRNDGWRNGNQPQAGNTQGQPVTTRPSRERTSGWSGGSPGQIPQRAPGGNAQPPPSSRFSGQPAGGNWGNRQSAPQAPATLPKGSPPPSTSPKKSGGKGGGGFK